MYVLEFVHPSSSRVLVLSLGSSRSKSNMVLVVFGGFSSSDGTSEEILVLLFGEVHVIVSVSMGVLSRVVSAILVGSLSAEGLSMSPGLESEVRD